MRKRLDAGSWSCLRCPRGEREADTPVWLRMQVCLDSRLASRSNGDADMHHEQQFWCGLYILKYRSEVHAKFSRMHQQSRINLPSKAPGRAQGLMLPWYIKRWQRRVVLKLVRWKKSRLDNRDSLLPRDYELGVKNRESVKHLGKAFSWECSDEYLHCSSSFHAKTMVCAVFKEVFSARPTS